MVPGHHVTLYAGAVLYITHLLVLCPPITPPQHLPALPRTPHPSPVTRPDKFNAARQPAVGSQSVDCGLSFQGQMRPAAVLFCHLEMGFIIERGVLHIYWAIVFVLISPDSHYMCSGLQVFGPFLAAHRICWFTV